MKNVKNNFQLPLCCVTYYFCVRRFFCECDKNCFSDHVSCPAQNSADHRPAEADGSQFNEIINLKMNRKDISKEWIQFVLKVDEFERQNW